MPTWWRFWGKLFKFAQKKKMVATAVSTQKEVSLQPNGTARSTASKLISWADFQKKYLDREDGFKYEWVNQQVSKSKHMDQTQHFITKNLLRFFRNLDRLQPILGELLPEGDHFFAGNHRRPDLLFVTDEQIENSADGINQVPKFVIEIVSTRDQANEIVFKMKDYRNAGVQVVWQIFPKAKEVHVYSGDRLRLMEVCQNDEICSASEVIPGFEMRVDEIFFRMPK